MTATGETNGERTTNNFDFIRIFAASLVVVHHSFALLGDPDVLERATGKQISLGSLGVDIFFVISGYLVTQSLFRSRNYKTYFAKRCLRIFPALIVNVVLTVLVLGPIVSQFSPARYFSESSTYRYLGNIGLYLVCYELPGVFVSNPYPRIVNGSLWTLSYEFTCYLGLVALHVTRILHHRILFACLHVTVLIAWLIWKSSLEPYALPYSGLAVKHLVPLGLYFGGGILFHLFRDSISLRTDISALLLSFWVAALCVQLGEPVALVVLPYIVVALAFSPNRILARVGEFGDWSYGTYIHSFPIQQSIIAAADGMVGHVSMMSLSFLFTIPIAVFSWFAIEKPALRVKHALSSAPWIGRSSKAAA